MSVMDSYREYIHELHAHLFELAPIERIIGEVQKGHRRKRFIAMYLLQDKELFDLYYEKRKELRLEKVFNQLVSAMLYKTEKNALKQLFVEMLDLKESMIIGKVSSYEIREIEKDLHAFSFYETKKELKSIDEKEEGT